SKRLGSSRNSGPDRWIRMPRLAQMPPIQENISAWTSCAYCVPVCPAYQEAGWEGASPRGRVFALRQYEMRGPLDLLLRRQVKPGEDFARNTWECTGCGACEEVCPVDIPFDKLWDDVKEWMVKSGFERKVLGRAPRPDGLPGNHEEGAHAPQRERGGRDRREGPRHRVRGMLPGLRPGLQAVGWQPAVQRLPHFPLRREADPGEADCLHEAAPAEDCLP